MSLPPPNDAAATPLEHAALPMLRVDARGDVTWMNGRARAWLLRDGAALPRPAAALTGLRDVAGSGSGVGDVVVQPAGGRPTACRLACSPWPGGGHLVVLTPVQDLHSEASEQGQATRDLLRRFQVVTRAAGVGYWTLEHGAERAQWSDELCTIYGLPPGSTPPTFAQWIGTFTHPADRERVRQSFAAWSHEGYPPHQAQFRGLRADGRVIDLITHSRIEGDPGAPLLFGAVLDVTERRAAEAALRAAGERAALVAQGLGIGTWELDLQTGALHWDAQMWRLRGLEPQPQPAEAPQVHETVHPDDRASAAAMLERARTESEPIDCEFRIRRPDGSWRWLASRSVVLLDLAGAAVRRLGIEWDITATREAALAQEQKLAAQRELQAKARFLSRMSHELRTPLNAVLGFTELLLAPALAEAPRSAESDRRRLEHIRAAGKHLLSLIDDVLELSRLEGDEVSITLEPVPLADTVAGVLPLVEPLARAQAVQIASDELDGLPLADATRLKQVLLNLLTNAIKYNRRGGRVTLQSSESQGVVTLLVGDTGRGMSDEQLSHLFEPFNRLGAETSGVEGTGIGLAIVKALVERMGGTIAVSSAAGAGTRVELRLRSAAGVPVAHGAALASPQELALAATLGRSGGGGSVLYIEDNPVNAMIVGELLARRSDLQLHVAADGACGLEEARARRPDLILLDMQLPDVDGMQVLAQLRSDPVTAAIPCIALSANAMPADIERALQAGVSDYWTKPLDFRAFMASIEAIFGPAP